MAILFANNALSKLAQPLTISQTAIQLQAGTGALFPSPTGGDYFKLTVEDRRTQQIEVMHCIGRSGDVLTVVRAQENMSAQAFLVGATASNRFTRDTPNAIIDEVANPNPLYLGAFSIPPTTDNDGNPLTTGMSYFDLDDSRVYYWTGASWVDPVGSGNITSASGVFVLQDVSGDFDGIETEFDLRYTDYSAVTQTPDVTIAEQFLVWLDGVAQRPGVDFTIPTLGVIEFTDPPTADVKFHGVWVALVKYNIIASVPASAAGVLALDFWDGDASEVVLTEDVTSITVAHWPSVGELGKMTVFFSQNTPGGWDVAWPVGWRWANGVTPTVTATALKTDVLVIMSLDAGATIFATMAGQNY